MSSLVKLSIQGIRSFGPDDSDRQVLKLYSPLTLIQGQNGTGKTTIIECLKYITTGGMPAGGKLQATFIHDPKIAHETTVKGQVRLQFNDITGSRCTTHRTIQATQMAKTIKTSSIDGMISKYGPDGTRNDITNRCADLDREMVSLLGVGKAVLESVIFCHQEDSCWPLSEGKALKAKFDDIFASTRYVKALEQILKERKEKDSMATSTMATITLVSNMVMSPGYGNPTHQQSGWNTQTTLAQGNPPYSQQTELKTYQGELKYLKQNKDKAAEIEADLAQVKTRYAASREAAEEVKEKLAPIEEKLIKLESKSMDIRKLITEVEKLKGERDQMQRGVDELKDSIETMFTGSTEDLEKRLSDFEGRVRECEDKLRQYEAENQRLETEMNKISDMKSNLLLEMGKLEQEAKAHEENLDKREKKIKQVAEQYDVSGFSGRINDAKVEEFQQKMEDKRKSLQQKGRDQRNELEEKENKVQANIDQIRQKIASLETEVKLKEEAMTKNKNEVRLINQKLSRVEGSSGRLAELKREIAQTKLDRDELDQSTNVDDLKKDIDNLSSQKNSLEATFKKLDAELTKMHQESTARTQLDMLRKEKTSKDDKIRKLLSKNEDALVELLGEVPQDRACRQLEDYVSKLDQEIGKDTKALDALRMQQAGKKQAHTSLTEQLANKKREMRDNEERISAECDAQDFDEARDKLEQDLRDKNDDKGVLEGTSAMFNKFKSKLQKRNPPCPLCHRDFEEETEVQELIDELETKLRTVPTRLEQVNEEIAELEKSFHRVLQLEPVKKSIIQIRDTDIPKLEGRMQSVNEDIEGLTAKIATKENELKAKQAKSSTGHSMVPDLSHIDRYQMELKDINKKIATQSAKVSGGDDGRTLQQVQRERTDAQESLDNARSSYERKQKKLMDHSRQLSNLDTTLNEMTAERLAIERDLQEQKENEERKTELEDTNAILAVEIHECQEQVQPLQAELKQCNRERQEISNARDKAMVKNKDELSKLQERTRDVRTIQDSIERYLKAGRDAALEDSREKQNTMETKAAALDAKRSTVLEKIEKRREDLQTQKLQERNLQDNLALRRKEAEVVEKAELIVEKQEKLGDLDTRNLERERQKLHQQQDELNKQKHQTDGRQQGFLEQIRVFKKDLEAEQYKDAEDKFRVMSHTLRTTEHVCSDLEKYYKAMDKAIMTFHKTKISEINKIIRELWRNTYKGHDIETIEIRSDDETEPANLGKRRTFNYRVVMIKGEVAIDMRGRCSAGQKVLSSLIIRLALAETFCLNCGMLALDEPTTNLDRENIESLAYALVEIIKTRSKQKNFQLVIITHDEDFVELLGRSDFVEKFVKVRKNEFGCSRLVEADVSELGTR